MDDITFITPTVFILSIGFCVILLCRMIRISPIIGFLLAGLIAGPYGLGWLEESKTTHFLAELGVVFLLFDIGLHFSMKSAWKLRHDLFVLAPLQMLLSSVILAFAVNFIFSISADVALLVGVALALSSTAVVMQILGDNKQTEGPVGQTAKSMLIFQDIVAIFLFIFADAVGGEAHLFSTVLSALLKTAMAVFLTILFGQYILRPLFKLIIKYDDPELFTVLSLVIVIFTAYMTANAGLSLTLGAFLAGMVLGETPFRVMLQNELRPFRSLLMAFFFVTIGMKLQPDLIVAKFDIVVALVILLIAIKAAIIAALAFIFGRKTHNILQLSFFMSQGSELAFVIFSAIAVQSMLGYTQTQYIITAVALSMLVTPLISGFVYRWSLKISSNLSGIANCPSGSLNPVSKKPVIVIGMREVGKTLARAMQAHHIPYIAVENDRQLFLEATAAGYVVAYGKLSDLRFWNALGVENARASCVTNPNYEMAKRLSPIVKNLYPDLKRYVAVNDSGDGVRFAALGYTPFHNRGAPPGLEMAAELLRELGISEENIVSWSDDEQDSYLETLAEKRPFTVTVNTDDQAHKV